MFLILESYWNIMSFKKRLLTGSNISAGNNIINDKSPNNCLYYSRLLKNKHLILSEKQAI